MTKTLLRRKIEFTLKNKKKLLEFAELATPKQKIEYLEKDVEFDEEFTSIYRLYRKYLLVTTQREVFLQKVEDAVFLLTAQAEHCDDPKENRLIQQRIKRINKIIRKTKRKLKYRVREKNYYDNYLVNDWIDCHNRIYFQKKFYHEFLTLMMEIDDFSVKSDIVLSDSDFSKMFQNIYNGYWRPIKVARVIRQRQKLMNEIESEKLKERLSQNIEYLKNNFIKKKNQDIIDYTHNEWETEHNPKDEDVFSHLVMAQADLIIVRQINRKHFHRFSTAMDDLFQEIRFACLTSMTKFNPTKGKPGRESFNWFSHICIKAGHMITQRKSDRDKLETANTDTVMDFLDNDMNSSTSVETALAANENDPLSSFYNYFQELFNGRERMLLLLQILVYYILNISYFTFKKNEFVKYTKSYGFTPAYVNKFLGIVRSHKDKFSRDIVLDI